MVCNILNSVFKNKDNNRILYSEAIEDFDVPQIQNIKEYANKSTMPNPKEIEDCFQK